MKNKTKRLFLALIGLSIITYNVVSVINYIETKTLTFKNWLYEPFTASNIMLTVSKPKPAEAEEPMKEWVLRTVKDAGLDPEFVDCLIRNESGWDNWAQNWNTNGTTDSGIFQINSVHKDSISLEDRFDYKTATFWSIAKIKKDGYSPWYGAKNCY